jgi:hypothetical protein
MTTATKRNKPLYEVAVNEAITAYEAAAGNPPRQVVQAVVRAYLVVAQDLEAQRVDGRISPISRALAAMVVGTSREFRGAAVHDLRQRMKTARDLLGEPDAKWSCQTQGDCVLVRRLPNGARYFRNPLANPKVRELVAMKVGETIAPKTITAARGRGSMGSNVKIAARKYLNDPAADWKVRTIAGGKVRVTRVK